MSTTSTFDSLYPQLSVFPLHPIKQTESGPACGCGNPECSDVGKHPDGEWGDITAGEKRRSAHHPVAGYGIATGARSGIIVVDIDSPAASITFDQLGESPDSYTVETGRGWQIYFQYPGFKVKNSRSELADGIDIRGDGGYVVSQGSPHKNGKRYAVSLDVPVAPAPAWLVEWLRSQSEAAEGEIQLYPGDVGPGDEQEHRIRLYTDYLLRAAPCVQGRGGDGQLFKVVQYGAYDLQLPTDIVLELVETHFDPKCEPPWGEELERKVYHKAKCAKTQSTRPRMEPFPADLSFAKPPKPSRAAMLSIVSDAPAPVALSQDGKKDGEGDGKSADTDAKAQSRGEIFWDDWDLPVEPPRYLISGLIPEATVGMLAAMGSSLKTWTALSMGVAVSKGADWLGEYPTKKGRVLIVDHESGLYELKRRIHLLERGKVQGLGAMSYPKERIDDPLFWKKLGEIPDLRLVIVDSLSAGAPGVDENSVDAALPLKYAARFSEGSKCAVLFIHHSKKDESGDARKAIRGSTAIFNDCDWAYRFETVEDIPNARRMKMVCIKPCMGPKPMPVPLQLTDNGLTIFEANADRPTIANDATPAATQSAIKLAIASEGGNITTKRKLYKAIGGREAAVRLELEELLVKKEIKILPVLGYVLDGPKERKERVFAALRKDGRTYGAYHSPADLATAAHVDTEFVRELVRDGVICRRATGDEVGGFIIVNEEK